MLVRNSQEAFYFELGTNSRFGFRAQPSLTPKVAKHLTRKKTAVNEAM